MMLYSNLFIMMELVLFKSQKLSVKSTSEHFDLLEKFSFRPNKIHKSATLTAQDSEKFINCKIFHNQNSSSAFKQSGKSEISKLT
ncbi:hypothetical protein BpHYR1_003605 [Brachionus plicatilis]|uniref:Uncharacterized protein n=1 Tax=Brachionus plicatilis TaxID=10195 RepID=A0A3M7PGT6_BRAPC|nr:hypothetical protein BpHYR1_003605 [Brachionus plicatilis]